MVENLIRSVLVAYRLNKITRNSILGLILPMRHGPVVDWCQYPGPFDLAIDEQQFHGIHVPRIHPDKSTTPVWVLFFKRPPIASEYK
jgi:hypothetical protein